MTEWILTSSLLILLVAFLRTLLAGHLSGRVLYALWLVVLLRLLIPVQLFTAPVSAASLLPLPEREAVVQNGDIPPVDPPAAEPLENDRAAGGAPRPDGETGQDAPQGTAPSISAPDSQNGQISAVREGAFSGKSLLFALYVFGAGTLSLVFLTTNLRFARRLKRFRKTVEIPRPLPLPVYEADFLPSPCLCGLFRPAIYVTEGAKNSPRTLEHVLTHEMMHYRHKDHLWSLLRAAALILHWYNPLVWWAVIASKQDGELACDEGAIRMLGEGERKAYGETLLSLLTERTKSRDVLTCATTMSGDQRSLRERFVRICGKRKRLVSAAVVVVVAVIVGAIFLFAGRDTEGQSPAGGQIPELALDVVATEGTSESVLEMPYFLDTEDAALQEINRQMAEKREEYEAWINADPANSSLLYAYPTVGASCVSLVLYGQALPNYGTDGELYAFVYDFVQKKEVSLQEALAASGWTEEAMHNALIDYIYFHFTDFGYPEDAAFFNSDMEVIGFRQRQDSGWDFFLQYQKPEDIYSDAWAYLMTFSDGIITKGIAIPTGEIIDIGCSLSGLVPYTTEGRSVVMTADAVMAGITAEDILYIDNDLGEPEAVAAVLNEAAEHVIAAPEEEGDTFWEATIYLSGGPDGFGTDDRNLWLQAHLPENIVSVRYRDKPFSHTVYVEDEALYTLLRDIHNYEGTVDTAAAERYADPLNAHMEDMLSSFQETDAERVNWADPPGEMAEYTGYVLLDFQEEAVYDDLLPGQTIHLYRFDYAITMEHPENMFWVGGNFLDGQLRMRGMDIYTYFAAALDESGELMDTRFFAYDLYAGENETAREQNARSTILYSFTHDVAE